MAKYRSPYSIGWRKPSVLFEDDPRASTPQNLEKYIGRSGRDVFIEKSVTQPLELDTYITAIVGGETYFNGNIIN